uniref:Chemokine interleukin-8-like domain-containing protein n=1 Tax=Sparus aurata TaxID=8175 RepID=A0A671Y6A8_SPAAU
ITSSILNEMMLAINLSLNGLLNCLSLVLSARFSTKVGLGQYKHSPATCCFKFFTGKIPQSQIISIVKTHSRCHEKGFVVSTARGREICVSQNLDWARKAFEQQEVIKDD